MKLSIKEIKEKRLERLASGKEEIPVRPSWSYRIAMATTKAPYNFRRVRARRKMAKHSRKINRRR